MAASGDDDDLLGDVPGHDPLARAVRKSRVARELFASDERVRLGRYQLLEKVGAGGLGVVWGAWDPELERRVAIKLIQPRFDAARQRILAEGQALAKVSHPNVVPVYDAGTYGEQVYLVMEWVRGQNLRVHAREPHGLREIIGLYRAAGEGLAAVHAAGLVHRDFKPDNAILGEDGRVRVLDFGLARDEADEVGAPGAGTPRYMAPEQRAGKAVTPAADQYAFCVALREAIEHRGGADVQAPVPGWIERIVERGTAAAPDARYRSMPDLLDALARDPRSVWRRRIVIGAVGVATAAAFAIGTLRSSNTVTPCVGGAVAIAKAWSVPAREALRTHVRSLGAYGAAEADRLASEIDAYTGRWAVAHRDECLAHERHELTEPVYARGLGCLARARSQLETVIEVLGTTAEPRLSKAIEAARDLPKVERCAFESAVSIVAPPEPAIAVRAQHVAAAIERVRVLATADDPSAVDLGKTVVAEADMIGYVPLIARANLAYGLALNVAQRRRDAVPVLARAEVSAIDAFDDPTLVEAHARAIYADATLEKAGTQRSETDYIAHVATRSGELGKLARALYYNNLGIARLSGGDRAGARSWFDRSLAEATEKERGAELLATLANRAIVTDDPIERGRRFDQARIARTNLLGPLHRKTLDTRFAAAVFISDPTAAEAELQDLCELYARYHATVAPDTLEDCFYELGWLADARGDRAATVSAMSHMRAGSESPTHALASAYLLAAQGKLAEASTAAQTLGDRLRDSTWERFHAADAYALVAQLAAQQGQRAKALQSAEAALALFESQTHFAAMAHYQRRVERLRATIAALRTGSR